MQAGIIEVALQFVADNPSWAAIAVLVVLLYLAIMNPVKVMLFHAYLSGLVEKLSTRAARHSVAADIQGRVAAYVNENHVEAILPYRLKFKWMRDAQSSRTWTKATSSWSWITRRTTTATLSMQ